MQPTRDDRSLGQLFGDLAQELTTLVRQEIALARTEIGDKATRTGRAIGSLAVGGLVAYAGLLAVVAAAALLLGQVIPLWAATLVVGLVVGGIGYVLVQRGLTELKQIELTPRRTVETIKDDVQWAKEQAT